jgi:hypothetical protein
VTWLGGDIIRGNRNQTNVRQIPGDQSRQLLYFVLITSALLQYPTRRFRPILLVVPRGFVFRMTVLTSITGSPGRIWLFYVSTIPRSQ